MKLNKQQKQTIFIVGILLLVIILFYKPTGNWVVLLDEENTIYSYHGEVPLFPTSVEGQSSKYCYGTPYLEAGITLDRNTWTFPSSKTILFNNNNYRFVTNNIQWGYNLQGNRCGNVGYDVEVYKNNNLIDSISIPNSGFSSCSEFPESTQTRNYDNLEVTFVNNINDAGTDQAILFPNSDRTTNGLCPYQLGVIHKYVLNEIQEEPECMTNSDCLSTERCVNNICETFQEEQEQGSNLTIILSIGGLILLVVILSWLFIKTKK